MNRVQCEFRAASSSETQGLLAGTMQHFWAKVYFRSRRTGNLFLPNQFQKWSNSVSLIGQKKNFSAQSAMTSSRVTLSPSYTKQFSSSINLVAWPVQREDCRGEFQKKNIQTKPRKSQALTLTNTLPSIFSGDLSKLYRL